MRPTGYRFVRGVGDILEDLDASTGLEGEMSRVLVTPLGYRVEDRPEGLYLLGDLDAARQFVIDTEGLAYLVEGDYMASRYLVEIGYGAEEFDKGHGAEMGHGPDRDTAWRYALGAHLGSHDDDVETKARG